MSTSTLVSKVADPFAPSTNVKPTSSPKDSSKDVTVPHLPELHDPSFLDKLLPAKPVTTPTPRAPDAPKQGAAFMAALSQTENRQYTENTAHGFKSTLSPTVDAFNGLSQATDPNDFEPILAKSWATDPLLTIKIIFNLRSIHEGKSEREGFYRAWAWLYKNHPRTAIVNLAALVDPLIERKLKEKKDKDGNKIEKKDDDFVALDEEGEEVVEEKNVRGMSHGYWKDLLNLLVVTASGELRPDQAEFTSLHPTRITKTTRRSKGRHHTGTKRGHSSAKKPIGNPDTREERVGQSLKDDQEAAAKAQSKRQGAHAESRARVKKLFETSPSFKALYITVARLFAKGLEADINTLEKIASSATSNQDRINLSFQLSLCGKYAPSLGAAHDRATNIASAIAELLWTKGKLRLPYDEAQGSNLSIEKVHDLRIAYTRWAISPLRRFLQIPELYMAGGRWNELPYKKVPSKCMQNNKKLFFKHDEARFAKYLQDVATGKRSISGGTLLPHTLLQEALSVKNQGGRDDPALEAEIQVIEAQWKTMVEKLRESGTLDNCLAVCDVSGSMGNIRSAASTGGHVRPILPAIALSIVLSQVAAEPWSNSFITFSERPEIVKIDPTLGLVKTANGMSMAAWDMNTDFNAVFTKLILPMAKEHKLKKEDMVKRLFVFSDMEFDQSSTTPLDEWTSEHEKVVKAFEEAGYDVPEIVYWNLQGARGAKPVQADWEGVAMMSGFSSNMLKTFMEEGGLEEEAEVEVEEEQQELEEGVVVVNKKERKKTTPEDVMKKALNRPSYATLVVVD